MSTGNPMTPKKEKNQPAKQEKLQVVEPVKQRPIHEVKMPFNGGLLIGAVWRNQNDQGKSWYSVSLSRAHKDEASGEWKYGERYSRDELCCLVRVIETIHAHLVDGTLEEKSND
jgi:hypothetical protein